MAVFGSLVSRIHAAGWLAATTVSTLFVLVESLERNPLFTDQAIDFVINGQDFSPSQSPRKD